MGVYGGRVFTQRSAQHGDCANFGPGGTAKRCGRLVAKAEQGDGGAIQQIADRLDGKCAQTIEHGNVSVEVLSDRELFAIIRGGSREPVDVPSYP
jgi:hypothetical protein